MTAEEPDHKGDHEGEAGMVGDAEASEPGDRRPTREQRPGFVDRQRAEHGEEQGDEDEESAAAGLLAQATMASIFAGRGGPRSVRRSKASARPRANSARRAIRAATSSGR